MLLKLESSECEHHQKIIVCKDKGERREYRCINPNGVFEVRKYSIDGNVIINETCCDFLVLNDTSHHAYYVELKGTDVKKAVSQLLATENAFREELKQYCSFFRIVTSRTPTVSAYPKVLRDLIDRIGTKRMRIKTRELEENME